MKTLVLANLHFLSQAERLVAQLDDDLFSKPAEGFYRSTIGGHLRHCLDHYDSFSNGIAEGRVNYDHRMRLPALESETSKALAKIQEVSAVLKGLSEGSPATALLIKMDCGLSAVTWQSSTVGRELQFLVSHTVHHFAMIGGICRELGVQLESEFGVAPSTIRHRAEASAKSS